MDGVPCPTWGFWRSINLNVPAADDAYIWMVGQVTLQSNAICVQGGQLQVARFNYTELTVKNPCCHWIWVPTTIDPPDFPGDTSEFPTSPSIDWNGELVTVSDTTSPTAG